MIVVRIELWPHGDVSRKREIARMTAANVSMTDPSDYRVSTVETPNDGLGIPGGEHEFTLTEHPRRQSIFALIAAAAQRAANL